METLDQTEWIFMDILKYCEREIQTLKVVKIEKDINRNEFTLHLVWVLPKHFQYQFPDNSHFNLSLTAK